MSFVSISLTVLFALQARRTVMIPPATVDELTLLMGDKKYRDAIELAETDESFVGKLAFASLNEASNGYGAMERALEESADIETTRKLRPIEYLNVLGNVSPMIGLFGTVYGMILAFQELVSSAGRPNPADLAAGISTALVTTLWGLVVAIPAIAAYTIIRNQIDALSAESVLVAEELIEPFKKKKKSSSDARPARPAATPRP
jgi:biopolymer transport protein ExbB